MPPVVCVFIKLNCTSFCATLVYSYSYRYDVVVPCNRVQQLYGIIVVMHHKVVP